MQNPSIPLLTNKVKLDEITNKFNKKCKPVFHFISSFKGTSYKTYKIQLPFLATSAFTSANIIWYIFTTFLNPHPLNNQNQLSVTTVFCQCSLMGDTCFLQILMAREYWTGIKWGISFKQDRLLWKHPC